MPRTTTDAIPRGLLRSLDQPVLDAGPVVLRPWRSEDQDAVVTAYADPDIAYWHARTMTTDEAAVWIAQWPTRWADETGAGWAVAIDDEPVGQISLRHLDHADGIAEVSYWVLPAARGYGAATSALRAVARWSFDTLGVHRVVIDHSTRNPASCAVATKAGFRVEGTHRDGFLQADGWHDVHRHARLTTDD